MEVKKGLHSPYAALTLTLNQP